MESLKQAVRAAIATLENDGDEHGVAHDLRIALSSSQGSASQPSDEGDDAENQWRRLALQFDGHRMQALWHLKTLLEWPQAHAAIATAFLAAPPLSGEKVLAERVAAVAKSARPSVPDWQKHVRRAYKVLREHDSTIPDDVLDFMRDQLLSAAPAAHRQAQGCHRSHPHENMNEECQRLTVEARETNRQAQQEAARKGDIVGWLRRRSTPMGCIIPGKLAGEIADHIESLQRAQDHRDYTPAGVTLGMAQYVIRHTAAGEPAQIVFSQASPEEVSGREVGDTRDTTPGETFDKKHIRCQIAFANSKGIDALETQLRLLRQEHFPDTVPQPCMQDWRPIETAPEEGCWALVAADGAMNCMFVQSGRPPKDWTEPAIPNIQPEMVTHWMPLRAAPTDGQAQQEKP